MGINLLVDILNSKKMGPLIEAPFFMLLEKIEAIILYRILVLSWIQAVGSETVVSPIGERPDWDDGLFASVFRVLPDVWDDLGLH